MPRFCSFCSLKYQNRAQILGQAPRYRRSIARTVLSGNPKLCATCRADADEQARPTASSKRLENGALLGNCATFSIFGPQSGQRTRYNPTTTVALYSDQGRSRISLSVESRRSPQCFPQPEQISFLVLRFRRTHNFSVFCFSSIS